MSRGPQAAAARSAHGLCSLVSRAHDSSQRRTERPTADRTLSAKKRACAFSLPLFSVSSSLFLYLFLSLARSLPALYCLSSLPPPFATRCHRVSVCVPRVSVCTREIRHRGFSPAPECHPRVVSTTRRVARRFGETTCNVSLQCCVFTPSPACPGILGYLLRAGPPQAWTFRTCRWSQTSREKCNARRRRRHVFIPVASCRNEND